MGGDIKSSGSKMGKTFGKMFALGGGLIAAAGIGSILSGSIDEAREAQKVGALTESIIKSTGGAAKISAAQVADLAGALSAKSGIDDEAIQSGANLLLTFKNVKREGSGLNDVFGRATAAATDLSAAGFGDLNGQAKMLGKALNDPIKGISALSRSGVTFTQQQQDQIKAMVESGNVLKAQKVILGEVESQVGGAAAATATAGDKASVALGNLKEQAGTALLPVVDSLANTFTTKLAPGISSFIAGMQTGTGAGGQFVATITAARNVLAGTVGFINQHKTALTALAATIATIVVVTKLHTAAMAVQAAGGLAAMIKGLPIVTALTKAWAAGQWLLNAALSANPIGLVIAAVVAIGVGLVVAYKKSETFRKIVDGAFKAVKASALVVANFFTKSVPAAFGKVQSSAASALGWVQGNWPKILAILTGPFGIAAALIIKNWDSIKAGGVRVVSFIALIPSKITGIFAGAATLLYNAGVQLMTGLASGITNKIEDAINAVRSGLSRLKGLLPGSPIKWGPLKNWNNGGAGKRLMDLVTLGITKGTPKTIEAAQTAFGKIGDALKSTRSDLQSTLDGLKSDFASLADSVAQAFTGDLFGVTATEAAAGVAGRTVGENFFANLIAKRADLTNMLSSFKTLQGWGLAPSFLSQLFASGNGALITELAGMGQSSAQVAGQLFTDVTNLGAQLGGTVASNDPVAAGIAEMTEELRIANRQLGYLSKDIGKELNGVAAKAQRDKKNKKGRK